MARQVFADPFGSYTRGYDTGTQREMALQQGVRTARDSDFDYYNLAPLRLNTAQRNDAVEAAAQPYRLQLPAYGFENARAQALGTQLDQYGRLLPYGIIGPTNEAIMRNTGLGYTGSPTEGGRFIDNMGNPASRDLLPEDYFNADPGLRKEQYQRTQDEIMNQYRNQGAYNDAIRGNYYGAQVQAQVNAAGNKAPGAVDGYGWAIAPGTPVYNMMFPGMGVPTQPQSGPAVQGAPPVQAAPDYYNAQQTPLATPQGKLDWLYGMNPAAPRFTLEQLQQMSPEQKDAYFRQYWPQIAGQMAGQ